MTLEFDSNPYKKLREESRKRYDFAKKNTPPGLISLMDQVRGLYAEKVINMTDTDGSDFDLLFDECINLVPGAAEAFEIWDKLFEDAEID